MGSNSKGRPAKRRKNVILEWMRDLYQRIFWFGLDGLEDDEDDYYLDEIDWLSEWNKPFDVGGGWEQGEEEEGEMYKPGGGGGVFRGAFPFDRQTYPEQFDPKKKKTVKKKGAEVVMRKIGEREETPVWTNVKTQTIPPPPAATPTTEPREEEVKKKDALLDLNEKKDVLQVSREVWKRRIADILRAGEIDAKKLSKARARLQEIDTELEEIEAYIRTHTYAHRHEEEG